MVNLGRLAPVELREAWSNESAEFTPWLASEENLALLGETIGLELECEAQEKNVGPFRADILCKDNATGNWVLVENQLERTDHNHLGQLLTYAAGLKAVTVVWVAQRFTDEHRATLDWLNEITDERFNFFGLEIELWRIGDSPIAPKFNVVCKPNDWSRVVTDEAEGSLTETEQLYLDYWHAMKIYMEDRGCNVQMTRPLAQAWMTFPVGRSNFLITTNVSRKKNTGHVQLVISGPDRVNYYKLLQSDKAQIEEAIGEPLLWRELPERKESHIRREYSGIDVDNRDDWKRQHEMFIKTLEKFNVCFRPRVKNLDVADIEEEDIPTAND